MRDNQWLENQLQLLLGKYFSDVSISNPIEIKFGREAKYRFGSIRLMKSQRVKGSKSQRTESAIENLKWFRFLEKRKIENLKRPAKSVITITSMFKNAKIPVSVVQHTIAHELCHYAHGFSSTNKRMFKHPHHGGIINAELKRRGAQALIEAFRMWLKGYRAEILASKRSLI